MKTNSTILKSVSLFLIFTIVSEVIFPTAAYALTDGPVSPEFSDFEQVASTDMVNTFTGDFSYNLPVVQIPGPDGSGYAMSLSYHSGVSSEEEASWVGYGWTLNPGSINRGVNGLPDDYKDVQIRQYNKTPVNWSVTAQEQYNLEIGSKDETPGGGGTTGATTGSNGGAPGGASGGGSAGGSGGTGTGAGGSGGTGSGGSSSGSGFGSKFESVSLGLNFGKSYNNYSGMSKMWGLNLGASDGDLTGNIGIQFSGRDPIFTIGIQPAEQLEATKNLGKKSGEKTKSKPKKDKQTKSSGKLSNKILSHTNVKIKAQKPNGYDAALTAAFGMFTGSRSNRPLMVEENHGFQLNYINTNSLELPIPIKFEGGYNGTVEANANVPYKVVHAYGYYYNKDLSSDDFPSDHHFVSDYHVEKGGYYNRRMKYLGIPFSSPDNFMVSGEGVTGGFRLFADQVGHYFPNEATSIKRIFNGGRTFGLGIGPSTVTVSIGTDLLGGRTDLISRKTWHDNDNVFGGYVFDGDNSNDYFFRFQNDPGGSISYTTQQGVINAKLFGDNNYVFGARSLTPDFADMGLQAIAGNNTGRSAYIQKEMSGDLFNGFSIVNPNGMKFNYREPLKVRNQAVAQVLVNDPGDGYITRKTIQVSGINNEPSADNNESIMGEFKAGEYASTYLLESITSPDYIDNAPLNQFGTEDLGAWTSFKYHKNVFPGNQWYRWRAPYNGLHYEQNTISQNRDDMGTVSYGEKEISYLKTVETKTHIAFFVTNKRVPADFDAAYSTIATYLTGSGTSRTDGLSAHSDESVASSSSTAKGALELEKLEKIVLFAKNDLSKPIQTTYFKYNNSLCRQLPNSSAVSYSETGKLTLERVWVESGDINSTRISPYIFKYEYKTQYETEIQTKYPDVVSYVAPYAGAGKENPDYAPQRLDRWGNNQYDGEQRFKDGKEWLYQGEYDAALMHDPAAWQLKQIVLPSGGEIHIQYEEKDYQYVQDKRAMAMVSLGSETVDTYDESTNKFYLNLEDLGIDPTNQAEVQEQYDLIVNELDHKYVYFKFLYALKGNSPSLDDCRSEYIDGYVNVDQVNLVAPNSAGNPTNKYKIYLNLGEQQSTFAFDEEERAVPKQVCYSYLITQRGGLVENNSCTPAVSELRDFDTEMVNHYSSTQSNIKDDFADYAGRLEIAHRKTMNDMIKAYRDHKYDAPDFKDIKQNRGDYCMSLNNSLSYIRIPMAKAKRGDGVRVKRLLMYDKGLETGDAALYGSEYFYKNEDGTSSGVATNEPEAGKEENALVTLLERYKQSFVSRIIAGRNKIEFEGPVGESLLPAPSVGHARVVVRNIHTGQTGGGFMEYKYHTCKEYPLSQDFTFNTSDQSELNGIKAVDKSDVKDNRKRDFLPLPLGLVNLNINKEWATQGYNFVLYNIHGQIKSISTYGGGVYDPSVPFNSMDYPLISQNRYEFFEPGEKIKMMLPNGNHYLDTPGKDMDITMEVRSVRERTFNPSLDFDVSITVLPMVANVGFGFGLSYSDALMNTHVTSKVTSYPVIQKKITTVQDGIITVTENVGFSPETGQPLLTKTYDSYHDLILAKANGGTSQGTHKGVYHTMSIPASWIHPTFGPIATYGTTNELSLTSASLTTYGNEDINFVGSVQGKPANLAYAVTQSYSNKAFNNVVASSVQTYGTYNFTNDALLSAEYSIASNLTALDARLRPKATYAYRTDKTVTDNIGGADQKRTYNSGYYTDFTLPDFSSLCDNNSNPSCKWLKVDEVTRYSPHGDALESMDIMKLFSAVRMGYQNTLPVMNASNATHGSIAFRSFEDETIGTVTSTAHSGKKSMEVPASTNTTLLTNLQKLTTNSASPYSDFGIANYPFNNGAVLKLWSKEQTAGTTYSVLLNATTVGSMSLVAQTGEWKLYQLEIPAAQMTALAAGLFDVKINTNAVVNIDDVRFEPYDCSSNCYVYDNMSRLITSFDDQHFGVYYQYDQEGKLVRKKIETEKGIMTVQENLKNTPTVVK